MKNLRRVKNGIVILSMCMIIQGTIATAKTTSNIKLQPQVAESIAKKEQLYKPRTSSFYPNIVDLVINEIYKIDDEVIAECFILNTSDVGYDNYNTLDFFLTDKNNKVILNRNFTNINFSIKPNEIRRIILHFDKDHYNLDGVDWTSIYYKFYLTK